MKTLYKHLKLNSRTRPGREGQLWLRIFIIRPKTRKSAIYFPLLVYQLFFPYRYGVTSIRRVKMWAKWISRFFAVTVRSILLIKTFEELNCTVIQMSIEKRQCLERYARGWWITNGRGAEIQFWFRCLDLILKQGDDSYFSSRLLKDYFRGRSLLMMRSADCNLFVETQKYNSRNRFGAFFRKRQGNVRSYRCQF